MGSAIQIQDVLRVKSSVLEVLKEKNVWRIYYMSFVMMMIHLCYIAFFLNLSVENTTSPQWVSVVVIGHSIMLAVAAGFGAWSFFTLRFKKTKTYLPFVQTELVAISYLLLGIVVTVAMQNVSPSITPFLLTVIGVSIILLISPVVVILNFLSIYITFYIAIGFSPLTPELLLSARISGFAIVVLSIGLAFLLWRNQIVQITQQQFIDNLEKNNKDPHPNLYNPVRTYGPIKKGS